MLVGISKGKKSLGQPDIYNYNKYETKLKLSPVG
jgi:hypothetical protein